MADHLRFAVSYWHSFNSEGIDIFGANCLGVADSWNQVRIGGALGGDNPSDTLRRGSIAVLSNSGGFTTTIAQYLRMAGWGTTTLVSSGKDVYIHYAAPEFAFALANDARSKAAVLYCEPGGYYERDAEFTKPVVASRLLETLAEIAGGGQEEPATVVRKDRLVPTLRTDVLEELAGMGLGKDFLDDFVDQCLRDASRCLAEAERGAATSKWEAVREAAHALKGVSENLGAQVLVERSTELMRASDAVLAKEWRRYLGVLGGQLEGTAAQVRREVARIASAPAGEGSRPPDHESG